MRREITADRIMELGHAFRGCKALLSAVELGVFTALAGGPLTREALGERVGLNERGARDFLDALVALGVLVRDDQVCYANTAETDLYLDRNKASYVGDLLEGFNNWQYGLWGKLTAALQTGAPQGSTSAMSNFDSLYAEEASCGIFAGGMTARTRPVARALSTIFPWAKYRTLVDIGTAEGCLPIEIAQVHPHISGGGFDLAPMGPLFDAKVQRHSLSDRLRFYSGDFFNDPFPLADVFVMGRVLHNWDLETKKMLLKKARDALPLSGALIVYERLIDDERRVNATALLSSLNMLLTSEGGFDFTGPDCVGWMHEIGFRDLTIVPLTTEQSMIIGIK